MEKQPREVHLLILSFLDKRSLMMIGNVNKYYRKIAFAPELWNDVHVKVYNIDLINISHPLCKIPNIHFFVARGSAHTPVDAELSGRFMQLMKLGLSISMYAEYIDICRICYAKYAGRKCIRCWQNVCFNCEYNTGDMSVVICIICGWEFYADCTRCREYCSKTEKCTCCRKYLCMRYGCRKYDMFSCKRCGGYHLDCKYTENNPPYYPSYCVECIDICCCCQEKIDAATEKKICEKCLKHYCVDCVGDHEGICQPPEANLI